MEFIKIEKGAAQKIVDYLAERPYKETAEIIKYMLGLPLFNEETVTPGLKSVEAPKEEGQGETVTA